MTKWRRILYQPNTPLGENGKRVTACPEHIELSKNVAKEGMVLLKNEGALLPLAKGTKLALFGMGTFDYVKGGGGSGDVTVAYEANLYDGFRKLGDQVELFEELADFYRAYMAKISDTFYWPGQNRSRSFLRTCVPGQESIRIQRSFLYPACLARAGTGI